MKFLKVVLLAMFFIGATTANVGAEHKEGHKDNGNGHTPITICHFNNGQGGRWKEQTVDAESIVTNGHQTHHNGQDIIPEFTYQDRVYPAQGDQSILNNGCIAPTPDVSPEPSPTATTEPSPTNTPVTPDVTPDVPQATPVLPPVDEPTEEPQEPPVVPVVTPETPEPVDEVPAEIEATSTQESSDTVISADQNVTNLPETGTGTDQSLNSMIPYGVGVVIGLSIYLITKYLDKRKSSMV